MGCVNHLNGIACRQQLVSIDNAKPYQGPFGKLLSLTPMKCINGPKPLRERTGWEISKQPL